MDLSLFIVVLGGRASKSNIEVHDVRWVVGETIHETFSMLRKEWFGQQKGLHIDSFKEIKYVDGYKIKVTEAKRVHQENTFCRDKRLYFINLGGYNPAKMSEEHSFRLVVADSNLQAKIKAKDCWKDAIKSKHNDNCSEITNISQVDDLHKINKIGSWEIKLILDPKDRNEELNPDWYGYMRIDKY